MSDSDLARVRPGVRTPPRQPYYEGGPEGLAVVWAACRRFVCGCPDDECRGTSALAAPPCAVPARGLACTAVCGRADAEERYPAFCAAAACGAAAAEHGNRGVCDGA